MTRPEVATIVITHLKDKLDLARVEENEILKEDLGMDSLDDVELIMEMERKFETNFPDDECSEVKTVGQMIDLIVRHV